MHPRRTEGFRLVGGGASRLLATGFVFLIGGCVLVGHYLTKRRARRRARSIAAQRHAPKLRVVTQRVVDMANEMNSDACVRGMVEGVVAAGGAGGCVRIAPTQFNTPIEPFCVAFEPRLLDEADVAFEDLQRAAKAPTARADSDSSSKWGLGDDNAAVRRLKRIISMGGGWPMFVVFVLLMVYFIYDSYQTRGLKGIVTSLVIALLGGYLWLMRFGLGAEKQWLVVPSGLVLRKGRKNARQWELHLFDRRRSVLCAYRNRRHQWGFAVADKTASDYGKGTKKEMDFLLRAWLSPLPPPEAEGLTDLL